MKPSEVFDIYLKKYETYNITLNLKRKEVDDLLNNAINWLDKNIHLLFYTCFFMFAICLVLVFVL